MCARSMQIMRPPDRYFCDCWKSVIAINVIGYVLNIGSLGNLALETLAWEL